ncbi:MAG TPA: hypothetical protein VK694_06820 [Verrucomicrobiae bacterium]|nr:hypothetical protein [Verrucomicrobiae bacterium]
MTLPLASERLRDESAAKWRWAFLQFILLLGALAAAVWVSLDVTVWIPKGTEPDPGFVDTFAICGWVVVAFMLLRSIPATIMEAKLLYQRAKLAIVSEHAVRSGPTTTPR